MINVLQIQKVCVYFLIALYPSKDFEYRNLFTYFPPQTIVLVET